MLKGRDLVLSLGPLDVLHVREHAPLGVVLGKVVNGESVGMEASQGDELPDKAFLGQLVVEVEDLLVGHTSSVPVEGRRAVVREHGLGVDALHSTSEFSGLVELRLGGLHPDEVAVRLESCKTKGPR